MPRIIRSLHSQWREVSDRSLKRKRRMPLPCLGDIMHNFALWKLCLEYPLNHILFIVRDKLQVQDIKYMSLRSKMLFETLCSDILNV
jgi:hypothetical protein